MKLTIKFIAYDDNLNEIVIEKKQYGAERFYAAKQRILAKLTEIANNKFGEGNWEFRNNKSTSIENILGVYASDFDGYTVEAKYVA